MTKALRTRLARLELSSVQHDAIVHVIPAHDAKEFEEKRAALIEKHDAQPRDTFVQVHTFTQTEPFTTGKTMADLLAYVATNGRKVHDHSRDSR